MENNDYFKIIYVILTELYDAKKQGIKVNVEAISPQRFKIADGYLLDILEDLLEEGYIKGFNILVTKTGRFITSLEEIAITMKGIEYLQDNSKMKKVYEALKNIKDIVPGF